MNLLYGGFYSRRFAAVIEIISEDDHSVLELCFGDTLIAKWCQQTGKRWTGIDLNINFVNFAKNNDFNARVADIKQLEKFPKADVCIMIGSLYHFEGDLPKVLAKILECTPKLIISEPIINLSQRTGIIGYIAKLSANTGNGHEEFRYTEKELVKQIDALKFSLHFEYKIIKKISRDIIIEINRV